MKSKVRMADIGSKAVTQRRATAAGTISMSREAIAKIVGNQMPKGDVLTVAEVAGLSAVKNTPLMLPLCHPLAIDCARVSFEVAQTSIKAECEVACEAKTGVEMEALTGVSAALLCIYDLVKVVDPALMISGIHLVRKEGGKSGVWNHPGVPSDVPSQASSKTQDADWKGLRVGVITLSDRAHQGTYEDKSGAILAEYATARAATEVTCRVIADDAASLTSLVHAWVDAGTTLILVSGGTGAGPRDIAPEALKRLSTKELSGFGELQRSYGAKFTERAWLSRSSAYVVQNTTLVVLFPGSPTAVVQGLEAVGALIRHAVEMVRGRDHTPTKAEQP